MTLILDPDDPAGWREAPPASAAPSATAPMGTAPSAGGDRLTDGLNPEQREAVEYRGPALLIVAGAGSGKTRVLVEKYFRLLADEKPRWPVDSVIAITFTVKAASELKARIVQRITRELDDAALPEARRARLTELRRELPEAPIGTIHNFCGRILREHAFDAGISPHFEIVEGIQESALRPAPT